MPNRDGANRQTNPEDRRDEDLGDQEAWELQYDKLIEDILEKSKGLGDRLA